MSAFLRLPGLTPELRASFFHFFSYAGGAVASVYFGIWLHEKGMTNDQIGIINAMPVLVMLIINQFIGRIADRASDWRQALVIMALLAGTIPIGMLFVDSFWGILLIWTMLTIPAGLIPSVLDAATLRMTQRNGTDFGFVRAWGTVGYTFWAALAGLLIARFGSAAFMPIFVVVCLARAGVALQLPRFRGEKREPVVSQVKPRASRLREVLKPWFVLPIVAFACLQATHSILGSFAALIWKDNGISEAFIGPLIATAPAAEAAMMFVWRRFGGRVSARHMILIATIACIVRWSLMALNPPVWALFFLQSMHAFTYALGYFGLVHFIANWTSEDIAAQAQGFAFVVQQALVVVTLLGFGWAVSSMGAHAFFFAAGFGVVALCCVVTSLMLKPTKSEMAAAH
ncbi:hypothetical protein GCM10011321_05190 [Youhaiella tibetensis]|nr:MFS transporter [Youhaiella tibetensis]GGF16240.1 hypothetical protein GCM10011321_05190 [Youhaiella tibetensis]